jgi:hypothetical protein
MHRRVVRERASVRRRPGARLGLVFGEVGQAGRNEGREELRVREAGGWSGQAGTPQAIEGKVG